MSTELIASITDLHRWHVTTITVHALRQGPVGCGSLLHSDAAAQFGMSMHVYFC
jgi:hypothetical protein